MKKYKLIHTKTKEEHLCERITIDGFDFYVSNDGSLFKNGQTFITKENIIHNNFGYNYGDNVVIATNNPNIDVSQIVDEVKELSLKMGLEFYISGNYDFENGVRKGYLKSQETHQFTKENMSEFSEFIGEEKFEWSILYNNWSSELIKYSGCIFTTDELLNIWKNQKVTILYYE
jgi:hypothetical protein